MISPGRTSLGCHEQNHRLETSARERRATGCLCPWNPCCQWQRSWDPWRIVLSWFKYPVDMEYSWCITIVFSACVCVDKTIYICIYIYVSLIIPYTSIMTCNFDHVCQLCQLCRPSMCIFLGVSNCHEDRRILNCSSQARHSSRDHQSWPPPGPLSQAFTIHSTQRLVFNNGEPY